jgi:3-methylcrotonyl-CoA carboxylase alpha subunit
MRLRCGEERFETRVREGKAAVEVQVAGRTLRFALEEPEPGVFVMRDGTHVVTFHVARAGDTVHLFWDGVAYALSEEREGTRPARRQESGALEAPMPGRVAALKVAPGQAVRRGDELVVVEAMKMENALRAPRDGVVRVVHVATGDMVAPGRALLEIE